jgi:ERCC4-type nuclease
LFHLTVDLWLSPPDMSHPEVVDVVDVIEGIAGTTVARRDRVVRHELRVDPSERHAALLDLARQCDDFDVYMEHLTVGDYCVDRGIVVERKTHADFAVSLADGRLFLQAAKLARCPLRPVILLEGPRPARMPDVHPHALKGAMASLAVMWRLPVLCARDPEDSLRILRFLADQLGTSERGVLKRYNRKPKRLASRKLYMLQGSSGCGSVFGASAVARIWLCRTGCDGRRRGVDAGTRRRTREGGTNP